MKLGPKKVPGTFNSPQGRKGSGTFNYSDSIGNGLFCELLPEKGGIFKDFGGFWIVEGGFFVFISTPGSCIVWWHRSF